jgi:hypothetical protein
MMMNERAEWANAERTLVLFFDEEGSRHVVPPDDVRLNGLTIDPCRTSPMVGVPRVITRFQAQTVMRQIVRENGKSLYTEAMEMLQYGVAMTAGLPESDDRRRSAELNLMAFTEAGTFERDSALIVQIGAYLKLDAGQLDRLFLQAATVAR